MVKVQLLYHNILVIDFMMTIKCNRGYREPFIVDIFSVNFKFIKYIILSVCSNPESIRTEWYSNGSGLQDE